MKNIVLICTHNGEKFIKEQIYSIIDQSKKVDYIYIFDFNSQDKTKSIILDIKKTAFSNIYLKEHDYAPGACLSFFTAFQYLKEKVKDDDCIFIADQDDVWLPHKVLSIEELFNQEYKKSRNQKILIFHDVKIVDENLNIIEDTFYTKNTYYIPRDLSKDRLILCNCAIGHTMAISGKMLKKSASMITPHFYMMHDWALILWASRFANITYMNSPLSLYRQHSNNILGTRKKLGFKDRVKRTRKFTINIFHQTKNFYFDLKNNISYKKISLFDKIMFLIAHKNTPKFILWLTLSMLSLFRGPTIKRKLISIIFIANIFNHDK